MDWLFSSLEPISSACVPSNSVFKIMGQRSRLHIGFGIHGWLVADTEGVSVNSSPPGQNGRHFADNMFKRIFVNENIWISNKI